MQLGELSPLAVALAAIEVMRRGTSSSSIPMTASRRSQAATSGANSAPSSWIRCCGWFGSPPPAQHSDRSSKADEAARAELNRERWCSGTGSCGCWRAAVRVARRVTRSSAMRGHLPALDHGRMDLELARYVIRINGAPGATALSAFPANRHRGGTACGPRSRRSASTWSELRSSSRDR